MTARVGERVADVRRIVVLRANAIGDFVLTEPALRALRAAYPDARITLVGAAWQVPFLARRPSPVDEVRVLPVVPGLAAQQSGAPPNAELPGFLRQIRALHPDLALQMHGGGAASNPLTRSFAARVSAGMRAEGAPPLDRELAYRYYQNEVDRYLELVGLVGAVPVGTAPTTPTIVLTEHDHAEAAAVLGPPGPDPLVALHPKATDGRRQWPLESFVTVAEAVHAAGARILLTGAPGDAAVTGELAARASERGVPVLDLTGRTGLGGLGALYTRCAVVAGVDTGPLHLARAVGAATVTVFWCGNAVNAGPATRGRDRVLISWTSRCPHCGAPCHADIYPARRLGDGCDHRCSFVADVPPEEMVDEVLDLLWTHADRPAGGPAGRASTAGVGQ